ncbi:MAG: hypothetical protein ABI740_01215 [Alphaproteobacteria bacterium]
MIAKHLVRAAQALFAALAIASVAPALAQPTHVMVRARSLDAKFIGTHTGGVSVVLTDASTGQVLAEGKIAGGTGDTPRIMQAPQERFGVISDADTAGFDAILNLTKPTLVKAEAKGPLGRPGSAITVSSMMWIIPGRDVLGDGWVLTFPGLAIEASVVRNSSGVARVTANTTMMCGCPITPGGLWDSNDFAVEAQVLDGDRIVARVTLGYAGTASQFAGDLPHIGTGHYTLRVVAISKKTPNTGVIEQPVDL